MLDSHSFVIIILNKIRILESMCPRKGIWISRLINSIILPSLTGLTLCACARACVYHGAVFKLTLAEIMRSFNKPTGYSREHLAWKFWHFHTIMRTDPVKNDRSRWIISSWYSTLEWVLVVMQYFDSNFPCICYSTSMFKTYPNQGNQIKWLFQDHFCIKVHKRTRNSQIEWMNEMKYNARLTKS